MGSGRSARKRRQEALKGDAVSPVGRIGWGRLEAALVLFFLLTPLVVVPGYIGSQLFCTLYGLPRLWFIVVGIFSLAGLYFYYLAGSPEEAKEVFRFWRRNPGIRLYLILLFWMGLACLQAPVPVIAAATLAIYLVMGLFWVVLAGLFLLPARRRAARAGLLAGFAVFVLLGLCQAAGARLPFLMPIWGPASTLGYRNPAGHFIIFVLPFLVFEAGLAFSRGRRCGQSRFLFLAALLGLLTLGALGLLFQLACRVAFLVLALQLMLLPLAWFWFRPLPSARGGRQLFRLLAGAGVGVVLVSALVFVFPQSRRRVLWSWQRLQRGGVAYLLEGRYYHWGNTLVMIREHPWLGVGPGNFQLVYPLYRRRFAPDPFLNYRERVKKTHNDYLQVAAEYGIPALVVFLLLWGRQFWLLLRTQKPPEELVEEGSATDLEAERLPLAGALFAFSLVMFFSFPLEMTYSRMFFFFLLALGEARGRVAPLRRSGIAT
jgi:O-antigen ligase